MEQKRKLEILVNSDFSGWRKWGKVGDFANPPSSIHGFGNMFNGLYGSITNLADEIEGETAVERCYTAYGMMMVDYAGIPFNEMDPQDEDFKFLFDYKEKLDELGKRLNVFIGRCHREKFACSRDWKEFEELIEVMEEIKKVNYGRDVLRKYGIDLSEPAPSQK